MTERPLPIYQQILNGPWKMTLLEVRFTAMALAHIHQMRNAA